MNTERESILVVDHNIENINFFKNTLQQNYIVITAKTVKQVLEIVHSNKQPGVVLLEIGILLSIGSELKQNSLMQNIPVIAITTLKTSNDDKIKALELGAIDCIILPVCVDLLNAKIKNYFKLQHKDAALQSFLEQQKENYNLIESSQINLEKAQAIANVGSLEWDIPNNIVQTSQQLDVILGEHLHSTAGIDSFLSKIHPEDLAKFQQSLEKALNGHNTKFEVEHRLLKTDGFECIVKTTAEFIYDSHKKAVSMLSTIQDISESYRIAQELRQHKDNLTKLVKERTARINAIVETAADGIITINEKGIVESYNHAAEKIFQWTGSDVIGKNISMLVPEPHRSKHDDYIQNFLTSEKGNAIGKGREVQGIRKNGDLFPLYLSVSHVKLDERHLFTGIVRDNSAYRKHQKELAAAKEAAEAANQAKSEFLANMSHEIRTPMNAIIGLTRVVLETELSNEQRKHLQTVYKSSTSLLNLLNEILDLSKLESGNMTLEHLDFNLFQTIEDAISALRTQAESKGLLLVVDIEDKVSPYVCGDSLRLRQILTNLVGNAIKFTETGSITIKVRADDRYVDYLHFSVIDTGIGIPADRRSSIFESFTQADTSTTRKFGGTGLGTTISKQFVELMNGRIWVESNVGVGSTFKFVVQLPESKNIKEAALLDSEKYIYVTKTPLKILLVEDIQANVDLAVLRLEQMHHNVTVAMNGLEAVEQFKAEFFDIILMDIQMPVMNGYEATIAIRKKEQEQNAKPTPVIALTASAMPSEREKYIATGMNGFVDKPIIFENLYTEMARLLPELFEKQSNQPTPVISQKNPEFENFTAIDSEAALKNWLEAEPFIKALKSFASNFNHVLEPLAELISKKDFDEAEKLTHKLKGVSGNLGMLKLSQLSATLDNKLMLQQEGDYQAELDKLEKELENVLLEIETLSEISGKEKPTEVEVSQQVWETPEVQTLLNDLKQAFSDCDPDSAEMLLEKLNEKVGYTILQPVIDKVDEFEFTEANEQLEQIIAKATQK